MSYINKLESGKLLQIKELMPSLDGQILSTKLCSNKALSLELYSLSEGESISTHNLMDSTLYVVLTGVLSVSDRMINKSCYYFVEKDTPCELRAIENTLVLIYTFANDTLVKNIIQDEPYSFLDTINLVDKSVSSKIIVQKKEISLTLFAFDIEEGLSTHKAGGDAMVIPLQGEVEVLIDTESYIVKEGDFIILPAGIPHSLIATKPYKMFLTVIKE